MAKTDLSNDRERGGPPDWDAHYAGARGGLYGDEPCQFLRMITARSDFVPRSALMLADGDGRNGSWLARQNVAVTAVDISHVATEKARSRDHEAGVEVERIVADLDGWMPPRGRLFDAAISLYLHCGTDVRAAAFRTAIAALTPGGWFVVEGFARTDGRPVNVGLSRQQLRYDLAELEAVVVASGLVVVEAFAGRSLLDEGTRHQGLAEVVRFAARRPA
jgi:SAM-dependent methyltransferase